MRYYEILGEDAPPFRGITLRQLNQIKKQLAKRAAAEDEHLALVRRMYKNTAEVELADKALDVGERQMDILLKHEELQALKTKNI
ncbi:hypothetical protein [Emcibacter sp.]|uniref:hypothetical protein n=1 Tax=Emcibacter sp. TaxID=1979954 RepID=UPI002AA75896|nr:hypothetical protein [Emcibacter sp.]